MTLDGMNRYLEDKGFHVTRYRDSVKGVYIFTIDRGDPYKLSSEFKYPEGDDWKYKNKCMMEFLDGLVAKYENPWQIALKTYDADIKLPTIPDYMARARYVSWDNLMKNRRCVPEIENVIHNDPATIVFWMDGTKTVVKCQPGDTYDPEKGLAMAISKKTLGNQGNYCNVFKKWLPEEKPVTASRLETLMEAARHVLTAERLLETASDT